MWLPCPQKGGADAILEILDEQYYIFREIKYAKILAAILIVA